ncbi:hypothetical protein RE6C_04438 [Rhodopirellula europaea 6C]|jgi:predicted metal-binding protein|uniref:Uncharacterized protein n=1 Tax=Rhodopirellula europaea 6C TaxID=1263867 RepID=M2ACW8_9BACT|nr:hypothetical protein RE6C_04438 [Rhodopirellula europaea 6C]|tara:strand:- start:8955 stop:9128 length:174 start_codon:yes stop_codon:yes gene_type:complete
MVLSKWFQLLDRLIQSSSEAKSANSIQLIQAVECLVTVIQAALATNAQDERKGRLVN